MLPPGPPAMPPFIGPPGPPERPPGGGGGTDPPGPIAGKPPGPPGPPSPKMRARARWYSASRSWTDLQVGEAGRRLHCLRLAVTLSTRCCQSVSGTAAGRQSSRRPRLQLEVTQAPGQQPKHTSTPPHPTLLSQHRLTDTGHWHLGPCHRRPPFQAPSCRRGARACDPTACEPAPAAQAASLSPRRRGRLLRRTAPPAPPQAHLQA